MQNILTRLLAMMISTALLWSSAVFGQSSQYFFVAYQAPEGSITQGGQGNQVVYLRWDVVEGALPADVDRLKLIRKQGGQPDVILLDVGVNEVKGASDIEQLYSGNAQERRLLEIILNLKEDAVADDRDFATNAFGSVIYDLINPLGAVYDQGWSFLASRSDINIARARYRAFVDDPGPGLFEYELLAEDVNKNTARLGYAAIDTTQAQRILPAEQFMQVLPATCDLPEMGKDHYSVSLNWEAPGVRNATDRFAAQVYVGGYDLYRTSANLAATVLVPPARDIAQEAATATHDTRGVPILAGLEKINDTLLTITPDADATAEWLETKADLEIVGMKPGDKRAYYLVPRDFTGNYGPTSAAIVVVPNLIRPAAPWELRPIARAGASSQSDDSNLTFSWDDVNLRNYLDSFDDGRQYCNLFEAEITNILEFVGPDENCDQDVHRTIRLDVSDYVVYRFPDFNEASKFKDSDGDGVADREERAGGTQCDILTQPSGALNYKLEPGTVNLQPVTLPNSGKQTWRFEDKARLAPFLPGQVLWYRVASKTPDGRLSFLSAPQRGMFPNRDLPPKPVIEGKRPGTVRDGCELAVDGSRGSWNLVDEIDDSLFAIDCPGLKNTEFVSGKNVGTQGPMCDRIRSGCNTGPVTLTYPDNQNPGGDLCTINLPADLPPGDENFSFCDVGQARLVPTYVEGQIPVEPGEVISGPLSLSVFMQPAFPDVCMDLYENIDGDSTRVGSTCDTGAVQIDYEVPSGFFCGYAVARDANNNVSPAASAPCTYILSDSPKRPTTPQPVSFTVTDERADISWRLPSEPIAVTLVSLEHSAGDGTRSRELLSVPSPGSGAGDIVRHTANVAALSGNSDEYCVRFQAIGPDSANESASSSGWSAPLCQSRRAQGSVLPTYLPWPIVDSAVEGTPLDVEVFTLYLVGNPFGLFFIDLAPIRDLDVKALTTDCGLGGTVNGPPQSDLFATEIWCNRTGSLNAKSVVNSVTPFLVYRQSRNPAGAAGDWVQVSPLIEYAHWDSITATTQDFDHELNDPYIKLVGGPASSIDWRFVFKDNYTYLLDWEYRYQIVYFDDDHRITRWRRSDWMLYKPGS